MENDVDHGLVEDGSHMQVIETSEIGAETEIVANEEIVTSSSSTIRQIYDIFQPLCDSVHLVSEFKTSSADNSDFIRIHNPKADKHFKYFPSLHLVVFLQDGHLFLRLFLEHKKVFKESVVKDIEDHLGDPEDYIGIVSVLSAFLSELSASKYHVCRGAFEESNKFVDLNSVDMRSVLIETEDSRIVYRSRQCYLLFRDSARCDSCTQLLKSVQLAGSASGSLRGSMDDPMDMVNGCLEVSMEENDHDSVQVNSSRTRARAQEFSPSNVLKRQLYPNMAGVEVQPKMEIGALGYSASKTKMSYRRLITDALLDSPNRMLKLNDIYEWIMERYPGFRENKSGFQNSIRHNLSLNKHFVKVEGLKNEGGKGGYWTLNEKMDHTMKTKRSSLPTYMSPKPVRQVTEPKKMSLATFLSSPQGNQGITQGQKFVKIVPAQSTSPNLTTALQTSKVIKIDQTQKKTLDRILAERLKTGQDLPKTIVIPNSMAAGQVVPQTIVIPNNVPVVTTSLPTSLFTKTISPKQNVNSKIKIVGSNKPSFSYKELIMLAIYSDPQESIALNDIYNNIRYWFPFYQQANPSSWQNSIRHNLSLNKCFIREASDSPMKGGFWTIDKEDETFYNLMNDPSKWITNKNGKSVIRRELCEIIAEKNPVYAAKVYARLDTNNPSAVHYSTESEDPVGAIPDEPQEQMEIKKEEIEYDEGLDYHEEEIVTSA